MRHLESLQVFNSHVMLSTVAVIPQLISIFAHMLMIIVYTSRPQKWVSL